MFGDQIRGMRRLKNEVVTPPRLERGTYSLEGCCSIQLSYRAKELFYIKAEAKSAEGGLSYGAKNL